MDKKGLERGKHLLGEIEGIKRALDMLGDAGQVTNAFIQDYGHYLPHRTLLAASESMKRSVMGRLKRKLTLLEKEFEAL